MNDNEERALLRQLEADPYQGQGGKLVALRFQRIQNRPSPYDVASWAYARAYARDLYTFAQQALLYWSPERLEREALRRAGDTPDASVIAREVQVFTLRHQQLIEVLAEVLPAVPPEKQAENVYIREMQFYIANFETVLLALERRAAAAEARATDYRLRSDLGQVKAAVENSRIGSAIADAIREAQNTTEKEHFERIDQALTTRLGPFLEMHDRTSRDLEFIAAYIVEDTTRKNLPAAKVRNVLAELANASVVEGLKTMLFSILGRM